MTKTTKTPAQTTTDIKNAAREIARLQRSLAAQTKKLNDAADTYLAATGSDYESLAEIIAGTGLDLDAAAEMLGI